MFHENRLLADDSHNISCLIYSKIRKNITKFAVCYSCDWCFKGKFTIALLLFLVCLFLQSPLNRLCHCMVSVYIGQHTLFWHLSHMGKCL